jgi:hypothetical protein
MKSCVGFKIALLLAALALAVLPQNAVAQRGGHFAGGGFHSGGFGGFHGGGFGAFNRGRFGGFHDGFRGGFGGFRGFHNGFGWRGWGYPGWAWGLDIGFGFGPYWGYPYWYGPYAYGYPYPYAYGYPYAASDYGDAYYGRDSDRRCRCDTEDYRHDEHDNPPAKVPRPSRDNTSPSASAGSAQEESFDPNYVAPRYATPQTIGAAGSSGRNEFRFAELKQPSVSDDVRPAVRNVIAALRAMPPQARKRQIERRYDHFSQQERQLLAEASQVR